MGTRRIPFDEGQAGSFEELTGSSPMFLNVVREQPRGFRTRPGISSWSEFPASVPSTSPVVAMAPFRGDLLYVTDNGVGTRKVYCWRSSDGAVLDLSAGGGNSLVAGTAPVMMTAGRDFAVIAGGGLPQIVDATLTSRRLGGTPPSAYDVALISQYVVLVQANDSGIFNWSFPGATGVEIYDTLLDFREAEARPDALVGCKASARELWMFGKETTQIYVPDSVEVFAPGAALEVGQISRRSSTRRDYDMAWFDDRRRFVFSDGRGIDPANILSDRGIAKTLEDLETVDDCFGFRMKVGNHDFLVWSFPTVGRTFAWDMLTGSWSEWRGWDSRWVGFAPTSYVWWPDQKLHLVGLSNGQIAQLSLDAYDDLGQALYWVARTGFLPGETEESRKSHAVDVRVRARRGQATMDDSMINVRWRDNLGKFCQPIARRLGTAGVVEPTISISPAGAPYEQRQYELSGAAADAYAVADAVEIVEAAE